MGVIGVLRRMQARGTHRPVRERDAQMPTISPHDLAVALFRGFLGREPQPDEATAFAAGIIADPSASGLSTILDGVARSEEANRRPRAAIASPALAVLQAQAAQGAATFVSVGRHCLAASFLRAMGLRTASYPFDWLFSSLDLVQQCLDTDFADFLDPAQYEPVPVHEKRAPNEGYAHHRLYRERFGGPPVFNHHDMTRPEARAHFTRAVERLRVLRRAPATVIYLGIAHTGTAGFSHAPALSRSLCRPDLDTFVAVEVDEGPLARHEDLSPARSSIAGDLLRVKFRPGSRMGGLGFDNPEDDDLLRTILVRAFTQAFARTA